MLTESARFLSVSSFLLNLPMSVSYLSDASVWLWLAQVGHHSQEGQNTG